MDFKSAGLKNYLTRSLIGLNALVLSSYGAVEIGPGYLIPELAVSSEYTTNASNRADAEEDWINTLSPSLRYQTQGTTWATSLTLGVDVLRYVNLDSADSENLNFSASLNYPNGMSLPYDFSVTTAIEENTRAESEFGRITRDRSYRFDADGSYRVMGRYSIRSGFSYAATDPLDDLTGQRSESESLSIPFTLSYRYSEVLSYGLGYQYGVQNSDAATNANDSTTHAFFSSATGQLLPLVDADLQVGFQVLHPEEGGSDIGPFASGGLIWQATSLTSVGVDLSAQFETTTGNRTSRTIRAGSRISHNFATNLDGSLRLGIGQREFSEPGTSQTDAREDVNWDIGIGFAITFYEHTQVSIELDYEANVSDQSESDYDALGLRLSASRPF